jgi:hypothetical protein
MKDTKGRIPLHWAAVHNNDVLDYDMFGTQKVFTFSNRKLSKSLKRRMVEMVLTYFPEGATYSDKQGFLPLELLLDLEYRIWTKRCALALVKNAPMGLIKRNPRHLMLPFMTAASIHDELADTARSKDEERRMLHRKLELTYAILLENPTVVTTGIVDSPKEKYLTQKLEDANKKIEALEKENRDLQN